MAYKKLYTEQYLENTATAIRNKNKEATTYTVSEMSEAIKKISKTYGTVSFNLTNLDAIATTIGSISEFKLSGPYQRPIAKWTFPDYITVTPNTVDYTYDNTTGTVIMVIPPYDTTITASGKQRYFTISKDITNGTASGASAMFLGNTATVTLTADENYQLPKTITVTGADYDYDYKDIDNLYTPLEYIESTGTQYIKTGVNGNDLVGFKVVVASTSTSDHVIIGQRGTSGGDDRQWIGYADTYYYLGWNTNVNYTKEINSKTELSLNLSNNRTRVADSTALTAITETLGAASTNEIYIFGANVAGSVAWRGSTRLYSCVITAGKLVLRNFIPVLRKSDGMAGLYDTIDKVFYTNSGTGSFSYAQKQTATITLSFPTADITISAICPQASYPIYITDKNSVYSGPSEVAINGTAAISVSSGLGYVIPDSYSVTNGAFTDSRYYGSSTMITKYLGLEYIETTGNQIIDTGLSASIAQTVDCHMSVSEVRNQYWYGSTQDSDNMMYNGIYNNNALEYNWQTINFTAANNVTMTQTIPSLTSNTTIKINGTTYSAARGSTAPTGNLYIFGCNNGTRYYGSGLRCYYFRTWLNSTITRRFYPTLKIINTIPTPTKTPGLYDTVNNTFYANSNSSETASFNFGRKTTATLTISNPTGTVIISGAAIKTGYSITTITTNCTASGDPGIELGGSATLTVVPNKAYRLPVSISVSGATYSYNQSTGVITLTNPTKDVTVTVNATRNEYAFPSEWKSSFRYNDYVYYKPLTTDVFEITGKRNLDWVWNNMPRKNKFTLDDYYLYVEESIPTESCNKGYAYHSAWNSYYEYDRFLEFCQGGQHVKYGWTALNRSLRSGFSLFLIANSVRMLVTQESNDFLAFAQANVNKVYYDTNSGKYYRIHYRYSNDAESDLSVNAYDFVHKYLGYYSDSDWGGERDSYSFIIQGAPLHCFWLEEVTV